MRPEKPESGLSTPNLSPDRPARPDEQGGENEEGQEQTAAHQEP